MDGEQRRDAAATEREGAAGVVDHVDIAEPGRDGQRLGEQSSTAVPRDRPAGDELEALGELRVGGRETGWDEEAGRHLGGDRRQPDELAGEVLLRSADLSRPAPQQVDPDTHRSPWFQKLGKNRVVPHLGKFRVSV